jgi:hypothetical protein
MVINPPTSFRLFALCENMKWAHLPVAGGIYDQHPQLLVEFEILFDEKAKYIAEQDRKAEADLRAKSHKKR